MKRASLASAALLVAVLASPSAARANGRFPEANQLVFTAQDPDLVLLRVTFGLLVSHDRGKTFDWVCEQSIGFSGIEDPMYTITPSKTYVGTTFQGLTMSQNRGCGWSFAAGDLKDQVFIDLSASPVDAKNIVVFASSYDQQDDAGNILFTSKVWETKDEAQTFEQLGFRLDPTLLGYTIDLTATDQNRMYITAVRNPGPKPAAVLLTSRDHGKNWEELPVPLESGERAVFVAGVDPNNAERVYLRTSNGVDKPTRLILREAVDGGMPTLRTLHTAQGGLLGFALSPDGGKVYIGGPKDGVKVANTTDFTFEQRSTTLETQCLAINADGLWACSNEKSGFIAGLSKDDGLTFEPRLHFCDIRGPLACDPGTPTNDRCNTLWPAQKALVGCGTDPVPDAGSSDASFGGHGFEPLPPPAKGCNCQASPAGPWGALVTIVGAAIALVRRARRRR